jgi:hypothetical protein
MNNNFEKKRMKVTHSYNQQQQQNHPSVAEEDNNTTAPLSPMSTDESTNTHNNNHYTLLRESPSSLFARANNSVRLAQVETDNQMIQNELANLTLRLDTLEAKFVQANQRVWITLQHILQHLNSPDNNIEQKLNNNINDKKDDV